MNAKEREEICQKCKIYNPSEDRCNGQLYLNPTTNEFSTYPREGFIRGCNCLLDGKRKNPNKHCIAGKW